MRVAIITEAHSAQAVEIAAQFVQLLDEFFLRKWIARGQTLPVSLGALGIWYEREDRCYPADSDEDSATCAEERFCTLGEMLRRARLGHGSDCDDIAPAHAALLRVSGVDTDARATVIEIGPKSYHVVVRRADGTLDDPCAGLGMATPPGYPLRSQVDQRSIRP